eukprot:GHVQ01037915.1.p1 GENE.GHVQ01037915.1~~GHVQ01037915.1.p1  ORF type:complete len:968 (+),score=171.91 GHVQ01037915.1:736-3639(+)
MADGVDMNHLGAHTRFARYINPEDIHAERWTSLFSLVQQDDVDSFRDALREKEELGLVNTCEVEVFGYESMVAHAAAFSLDNLQFLIEERNCDVNLRSSGVKDQTPLFSARGDCITHLMSVGADQYARNSDGDTPFTAAIRKGDYEQAVEFLKHGLDPAAKDLSDNTMLFLAVSNEADMGLEFAQEAFWDEFFDHVCEEQSLAMRRLINMKCRGGNTCLHAAVAKQRGPLIKKFLEWGANPEVHNDEGDVPHIRQEWSEGVTVRILQDTGEDTTGDGTKTWGSGGGPGVGDGSKKGMDTILEEGDEYEEGVEEEELQEGETEEEEEEELDESEEYRPFGQVDDAISEESGEDDEEQRSEELTTMREEHEDIVESLNDRKPVHDEGFTAEPIDENLTEAVIEQPTLETPAVGEPSRSVTPCSALETPAALPTDDHSRATLSLEAGDDLPTAWTSTPPRTEGRRRKGKTRNRASRQRSHSGMAADADETDSQEHTDEDGGYNSEQELSVHERVGSVSEEPRIEVPPGPSLEALEVKQLQEERLKLCQTLESLEAHVSEQQQDNNHIQEQLFTYYENQGSISCSDLGLGDSSSTSFRRPSSPTPGATQVSQSKYAGLLRQAAALRQNVSNMKNKTTQSIEALQARLATQREKADNGRTAFTEFKRQIALNSVMRRTSHTVSTKTLNLLDHLDNTKNQELEHLRAANIFARNQLTRLEQQLRKRDELAENLHVIDFEQLKIENQTLNEKIEERKEELRKLQKKTVTSVQVITHWREKLHFLERESYRLQQEQAEIESEVTTQRDLVAKTKQERDTYRIDNAKLRQHTGIINSDILTQDFEQRQRKIVELKTSICDLHNSHAHAQSCVRRATRTTKSCHLGPFMSSSNSPSSTRMMSSMNADHFATSNAHMPSNNPVPDNRSQNWTAHAERTTVAEHCSVGEMGQMTKTGGVTRGLTYSRMTGTRLNMTTHG